MRRTLGIAGLGGLVALWGACSSKEEEPPQPTPTTSTSVLAVKTFDVLEPGWGDAPVSVHFVWSIESTSGRPLTCKLDFDGDGTFDQEIANCSADTSAALAPGLPTKTYAQVGEHKPRLVVTDGERSAEATQKIFANKLDFAKNVVFPEKLPGFVKAEATPNTKVVLTFATDGQVPDVKSGDVIWGTSQLGYLIKAATATKAGPTLTIEGTQAKFTDAIENGFFGARDVVSTYEGAKCYAGDCTGITVEKLAAPVSIPVGPTTKSLGRRTDPLTIKGSGTFGLKVNLPNFDGIFEHSIFAGIQIKEFKIDIGFFKLKLFNFELTPTFQYEWAVKKEFKKTFLLGSVNLGVLPLGPFVIAPTLFPSLTVAFNIKFGGSMTLGMPLAVFKEEGKDWDAKFAPTLYPSLAGPLDPYSLGLSVGGDVKLGAYLNSLVQGVAGPFFGPNIGLGVEGKLALASEEDYAVCKEKNQVCATAKASAGIEFGVDCPWIDDAKVSRDYTIAEVQFYEKCTGKPDDAGVCGSPPPDTGVPPADTSVTDTVPDVPPDTAADTAPDTSVADAVTEEICDGIDNDGDGAIDEGCPTGFSWIDLSGLSPTWGYTGTTPIAGGSSFSQLCAFPQTVVGICGRYDGSKLTAFGAKCNGAKLVTDKTVTPYGYTFEAGTIGACSPTGMSGASSGGTTFDFDCPPNTIVQRVSGTHGTTITDRIGQVQVECVKYGFARAAGNLWSVVKESTSLSPVFGPGGGLPFDWAPSDSSVGTPSFIRGFGGRYIVAAAPNNGLYQFSSSGRSFKLLVK